MPSHEVEGGRRPIVAHRRNVHAHRVHSQPHKCRHVVACHRNEEGKHGLAEGVEVTRVGVEPQASPTRKHLLLATAATASKLAVVVDVVVFNMMRVARAALRGTWERQWRKWRRGVCEALGACDHRRIIARGIRAHEQLHSHDGEDGHEAHHEHQDVGHCRECVDQCLNDVLHVRVANEQPQRAEHAHHTQSLEHRKPRQKAEKRAAHDRKVDKIPDLREVCPTVCHHLQNGLECKDEREVHICGIEMMLQGAVRALVVLARTRSKVRAHVLRVATWAVEHEADGGDGDQERDEELKAFIGDDPSGSLAKRRVVGTYQLGRLRMLGFRDSVWITFHIVIHRVAALLECLEQNCHEEVHEPQVPDYEHRTKVEHGWRHADGKVALFRQVHDACGEQFKDSERRHPEEFKVGVRLGRQLREAKELHADYRKDEHHATHENEQVGDLRNGVYEGDNVPVHGRPLPNHAHGAHHTNHSQQSQC